MLSLDYCRQRQSRLLQYMETAELDLAVISSARLVYYFTGALVDPSWPQAFVLASDGDCVVVTNREPDQCAARVRTYTGYTLERPFGRHSMHEELVGAITEFAGTRKQRTGVEFEAVTGGLLRAIGGPFENLTPVLVEMRRRKDPDEIESMRATVRMTEAGYAAIKARIDTGMTEYQAFSIIHEAMVTATRTSVDLNGDFACGTRGINGGGPPTDRRIETGDLYILDLFPVYQGYKCDLCRTFCVGPPTGEQQEVWAHVREAHRIAHNLIRPGASARTVYESVRAYLEQYPSTRGSFTHHAGHGVGMEAWEQPWLNAGTDQQFVENEVIACEPGLYAASLNGGIRLEHNYLVTADGPLPLDTFPLDL